MMPNITRGSRMAGLVMYLAGPGRANEHENPHIVAGDELITFQVEPGKELSSDDALDIANIMNRPAQLYGTEVTVPQTEQDPETGDRVTVGRKPAGVWHCSLSLSSDEGKLSDEMWQKISSEFVEKMGFIDPEGDKSSRWVAIRHGLSANGNDHVHIAVHMVREDGTKANVHNDFARAQKACNELEKKYGLSVLESREQGKSLAADKPAERARAQRQGRPQSDRNELRRRLRSALATASTEAEYVQHLVDSGVRVRPYFERGSSDRIAGYRVALPPTGNGEQRPFWYAPSKLDRQLAWPRIQERFEGRGRSEAHALLKSLHEGSKAQPSKGTKLPKISAEQAERLISGKATPDSLANIYARVSMSVETRRPGVYARLSHDFAQISQGGGNAMYAVRLAQRAGAKNSSTGWVALIQQANRLARVTASKKAITHRPQWSQRVADAVMTAEKAIAAETATARTATPGPSQRPRPIAGHTPDRGTDYGR